MAPPQPVTLRFELAVTGRGGDVAKDELRVDVFEQAGRALFVDFVGGSNDGDGSRARPLRDLSVALETADRSVTIAGVATRFSKRELALLELFLRNRGRTVTRTMIAERVWEASYDLGTNLIEVTNGRSNVLHTGLKERVELDGLLRDEHANGGEHGDTAVLKPEQFWKKIVRTDGSECKHGRKYNKNIRKHQKV